MRATVAPIASAVSAASSATGRSLVPAQATATRPARGRPCGRWKMRASGCHRAFGQRARSGAAFSSLRRVTSTGCFRRTSTSTMPTRCSGDLPSPYTTSGNPKRTLRWVSTVA